MKVAKFVDNGNHWHHPHKAVDVLCADGKRRTVRLNQCADTLFSWPGRCTINGKTVTGFITTFTTENGETDMQFTANGGNKEVITKMAK